MQKCLPDNEPDFKLRTLNDDNDQNEEGIVPEK